ncbi:hypothetical protein FS837_001208 [Tulasnella sp. UAMH 9824]|nr:hypothetical protein FS837_001208 [Tulasnella sp. UAMH 9824]
MSVITTNPFYFPAHEVQRPPHDRIHIRSAEEAHMLFESVRLGILRPVIRRLNDAERAAFIRSGSVFVWEESEEAIGLRRWTDGLMWSPSRMREPFLFYESKRRSRSSTVSSNNGERRSTDTLASTSSTGDAPPSPRSSMDQGIPGLVKQTYSAIVMGDGIRRKWHMTAYFTNADFTHLPTIQDDPRLRGIKVPKGMYRSGKSRQSAKSLQEAWNGSSSLASASNPDLHFSSHERGPQGQMIAQTASSSSSGYESASPSGSPLMEHPRRSSPPSPYSRPPSSHRRPPSPYSAGAFPPPSTPSQPNGYPYGQQPQPLLQPPSAQYPQRAAPVQPRNHVLPPLQSTYADQRYVPPTQRSVGRTAEDERMLQKFRPIP